MKNIFLFFGILITLGVQAQNDSLEYFDFEVNNILDANSTVMHILVSGTDTFYYLAQGGYIQPLLRSSNNIYPRSTGYDFVIGATTQPYSGTAGAKKLYVVGKGYFSDELILDNKLRFGTSGGYIDYSSGELYLYSSTSGLNSLADLISGGSSISLRNGMQEIGDYGELGGNLIKNTPIYLSGYTFSIGEVGTDRFVVTPTGDITSDAYATNYLLGSDIMIVADGSFRLYSQSGAENMFRDYTSIPYGLNLYAWDTYWANIKNDDQDEALVPYGGLKDALSEYEGGAGGVQDQDLLDEDTLYIKLWNEDLDTFAVETVVIDTIACDLYEATLLISSANILGADSLHIASAPGSGKAIIPIKAVIYYDYNAATYASGATSYIRTNDFSETYSNIMSIDAGVILQTSDKMALSTDEASASVGMAIIVLPNSDRGLNQPYWLQIGAGFTTGDGTFILKFYYTIADFN